MPVPVISISQMRDWEQATWAAGQQEAEVIRRVGQSVAHRALQLTQAGDLILLLAGKGHNGDDARAAREHLPDRRVELFDVADPTADLPKLDAVLASRPADMVRLLDFMLHDWKDRAAIDPTRVGLFGFSRGGYTGLVLAGGNPDFRGIASH